MPPLRPAAQRTFAELANERLHLVKLLLLSSERTFGRKVRELILAYRVEAELTKDEILHLYLNHINFGQGRYGVQEAAQYYFGKNAEDLTLAEASLLAGTVTAESSSHIHFMKR